MSSSKSRNTREISDIFHFSAIHFLPERHSAMVLVYILEKWFPLWGERAHSLKLFCMYDKRFEI